MWLTPDTEVIGHWALGAVLGCEGQRSTKCHLGNERQLCRKLPGMHSMGRVLLLIM